mgnify:CR=1 FL=1
MQRAFFLFGFGACLLIGCAKGDDLLVGGGGSGAGDSGTGGETSTTTTTGPGATTSTGPGCSEQPCKLGVPQCGCAADEQCSVGADDERACEAAGTVGWGQSCNGGLACAPGFLCAGYANDKLSCAKFCNGDSDCEAPGGLCAINLNGQNNQPIPGVTLCSQNCNLVTNSGCQVSGTSCQLGLRDQDPFTLCAPSGTGVYQTLCADNAECAAGHVCLPTTNNDDRCFQWCQNGGGCPNGLTCQTLEVSAGVPLTIGGVTFGACT